MKNFIIFSILLGLATEARADENYLRLYFMPSSPVRIEWDSPKNLVDSTIAAGFSNRNHPISHVNVEVKCADSGIHFFAGAVSADKNMSMKLLFEDHVGLSIMAGAWAGRLENEAEILDSLRFRGVRNGMLSAATFKINNETCLRLNEFNEGMKSRASSRFYGFAARPRRHEGAGCSAFAASFLEVAGILSPEIRASWITDSAVPRSLMTTLGLATRLTVQDILHHPDVIDWAGRTQSQMRIVVYDPDRMHVWVENLMSSPSERLKFNAELDQDLPKTFPKILALNFDRSDVQTPTDSIFTGEPDLVEARPGFVIRKNIEFAADGSFEMFPE